MFVSFSSGVEEADYYQSVNDPFVRDAPTRQSMSEKRHGAAKLDPSSTLTFQRIKHHRQSSGNEKAAAVFCLVIPCR